MCKVCNVTLLLSYLYFQNNIHESFIVFHQVKQCGLMSGSRQQWQCWAALSSVGGFISSYHTAAHRYHDTKGPVSARPVISGHFLTFASLSTYQFFSIRSSRPLYALNVSRCSIVFTVLLSSKMEYETRYRFCYLTIIKLKLRQLNDFLSQLLVT